MTAHPESENEASSEGHRRPRTSGRGRGTTENEREGSLQIDLAMQDESEKADAAFVKDLEGLKDRPDSES